MPIDYGCGFDLDECAYCGDPVECDDHVKPFVYGGKYTIPCCWQCNSIKQHKGLKTFLRYIRDYWPEKWDKIVAHYYRRRNFLSRIVHEVQCE